METTDIDPCLHNDAPSAQPSVAEPARQAAKERALSKFIEIGTVKGACAAAGVPRRTWYNWMETDQSFAARVVDASEEVSDELEEEAIARAKNGSDTLLMFLLRARRPAVYREKHTITVVSPEVVDRHRVEGDLPLSGAQKHDEAHTMDPHRLTGDMASATSSPQSATSYRPTGSLRRLTRYPTYAPATETRSCWQ